MRDAGRVASKADLPILDLPDGAAWRRWLDENHAASAGVWLMLAKRSAPRPGVAQAVAIEEAVCFGWIDGQVRRHDEHFYLQRFTPRTRRSRWSEINRERARRLIAEGRMHAAGAAAYRAAQADGRLDAAYAPQSRATVPEDLQEALDRHPKAQDFFLTLRGADRYSFLYRLHNCKDPARRAQRIARYVELLGDGKTLGRGG
jgi:uncharacterized protein YdeI (YjbR/CyaY-like superfamily)